MTPYQANSARLLAGCLTDPVVLELADHVEVDDFAEYQHRAAFASIRSLQAAGEPIGIVEVFEHLRLADIDRGTHVAEWVSLAYLVELVLDAQSYCTEWAVDRIDGVTYVNGYAVNWPDFLDRSARAADAIRHSVDDVRLAACDRLGITTPGVALDAFDFTPEQRATVKRDFVCADARTLRYYRNHPEFNAPDEQDTSPAQPVQDVDQRVRERRQPRSGRARRPAGEC